MRIKLDENIPVAVVTDLEALGHDVDTVPREDLAGRADSAVWQATQEAGRFLITQDLDFSDVRRFAPGTHHGLLLLRIARPGRTALRRRLRRLFETERVDDWARCFIVATDRKIRLRRAPT